MELDSVEFVRRRQHRPEVFVDAGEEIGFCFAGCDVDEPPNTRGIGSVAREEVFNDGVMGLSSKPGAGPLVRCRPRSAAMCSNERLPPSEWSSSVVGQISMYSRRSSGSHGRADGLGIVSEARADCGVGVFPRHKWK
ncbi:hypothetical protein [Salinigranum halophilum]|uniref:hypothetical protein n=1 Tax=Salinigranum halophilum TaxID=2565931 RepID=UPI001375A2F9|nr:hypothetical protein [Salinigranum halophilum]